MPERAPRPATMSDVARAAGVSQSTVSFVLNDTPGQSIRESTRERVRAAARELGYAPQGMARALREGRSRTVLLDVGAAEGSPSLGAFVAGMAAELSRLGHALLVAPWRGAVLAEAVAALAPRAVVDVARPFADPQRPADPAPPDGGWVHGPASHTLTQLRHLVERGHRHVAFAVPEAHTPELVALRVANLRLAAAELGVPPPRAFVVPDEPAAARAALVALWAARSWTTAVAAFDDAVALRVLRALVDMDLRAPRDLAVIGFDDAPCGALSVPALTSVHIDATEYGRRAARIALGRAAGRWPSGSASVVVRESV